MTKKYEYEEVKEFIETESDCKLLSKEYIGMNEKLKLLCGCGNEFETTFNKFKGRNKRQCNDCKRSFVGSQRIISYDTIKLFIEGEEGNGCKLISSSEYFKKIQTNNKNTGLIKSNTIKLQIKCKCGTIFETNFNNFKNNNKRHCKDCGEKIRLNKVIIPYEYIKNFIEERENNKFLTTKEEYMNTIFDFNNRDKIGVKYKLKIKCSCGNIYKNTFDNIKNNEMLVCDECFKKYIGERIAKTHEDFLNEVYALTKDEYKILTKYNRCDEKILFKHNICGNEFWMSPPTFTSAGHRCPRCNQSKGEKVIMNYLIDNKFNYDSQHTIQGLIGMSGGILKFDFVVLYSNNNLKCLIEYDGKQHFEPVCFGKYDFKKAEENFHIQQLNDNIKNEYCQKNNIKLIRIPYWDFDNIEKILDKELNKNTKKEVV